MSFGKGPETGLLLAPTVHHFIELLNGVLQYDRSLVLRLAAEVMGCSKRFNYNLDSIAMGEIVKLVESSRISEIRFSVTTVSETYWEY